LPALVSLETGWFFAEALSRIDLPIAARRS
jgi:hypothetical protein